MAITPELKARADAQVDMGIQLLDQKFGKRHWLKKVVPDRIDQASTSKDVLGQIYGSCEVGMRTLGFALEEHWDRSSENASVLIPSAARGGNFGFALGREFMTWEALNASWREKLTALRSS